MLRIAAMILVVVLLMTPAALRDERDYSHVLDEDGNDITGKTMECRTAASSPRPASPERR